MKITNLSVESINILVFPDGRLDAKNAALYLGLKDKTLAIMRSTGSGPRFIKKGRVFYYKDDLDDWLNKDGRFDSTTQLQHCQSTIRKRIGEK